MLLVLALEIGIGKINGGAPIDYLTLHEKVVSTDNEQYSSTVYQMTTLKNGATEIIFELNSGDYDYQKKFIVAKIGSQKLKGNFINNRFYRIETPEISKISHVNVHLTVMEGTNNQTFMTYQFNLPVKKGKLSQFKPIESFKFDELLIDHQIKKTNQSIAKENKQIEQIQQKIQDEQEEVKQLQDQLQASQIKAEQHSISQQIGKYQEGMTSLSVDLSGVQSQLQDNQAHLKQLQTEKEQIHAKRGK